MRSTLKFVLVSVFVFFGVSVQAATHPVLSAGSHVDYAYNGIGKFTDTQWKFSLAQDSVVSFRLTDIESSVLGLSFLDNRNLKGGIDGAKFGEGEWFTRQFTANVDYMLTVSGKAIGLFGGKYKLETQVAPVPLPAAFWLLGTAVVGFVMFSRRRQQFSGYA